AGEILERLLLELQVLDSEFRFAVIPLRVRHVSLLHVLLANPDDPSGAGDLVSRERGRRAPINSGGHGRTWSKDRSRRSRYWRNRYPLPPGQSRHRRPRAFPPALPRPPRW